MKVTIITVVYNNVYTIEKTIQSVINQSYKNIEYIIIDGGSTDGTLDIIQKYENYISYWKSEPDNGIYDAMNKGLKQATGDIIGIINSDDWYESSTVYHVVNCFKKNKCDVVHGDIILTQINGDPYMRYFGKKKFNIWRNMPIYHPTCFVKKELYMRYGFFNTDYNIAADYELILRLYMAKASFFYLSNDLAYFRIGGVSHKQFIRSIKEAKDISIMYGCNQFKANLYYTKNFFIFFLKNFLYKINLDGLINYYRKYKNNNL